MKYKVLKGTELFAKLTELNKKILAAKKEIKAYVLSVGGKDFGTNMNYNLVKLDAVQFEEKPEGWRSVGPSYQRFYTPKASNKKVWEAIRQLPNVDIKELNAIVGYDQFVGRDLAIAHRPGVHFGTNEVLIEVAEEMEWYKPVKDMVEIPVTEFNKLRAKIENRKEK
jgi:hypothetical protein